MHVSSFLVILDAPSPYHFYFQDLGAPLFEGLAELHDTRKLGRLLGKFIVIWLTLAIIPLCILSSWEMIADERRMKLFLVFYLILEVLLIGVFTCCWDFFLFYFVFEFVLVPIYFIIGMWGSKKNRILSSYQLFLYTILGSFFMLIAMWMIFFDSGTFCYFFLSGGTFSHLREIVVWLALIAALWSFHRTQIAVSLDQLNSSLIAALWSYRPALLHRVSFLLPKRKNKVILDMNYSWYEKWFCCPENSSLQR